jgi:dTDP-4-dehydrorhamnose reductase
VKVLVTGASGLLGTKLAQLAQESGHNVESAYGEHAPQFGKPIRLDITSETDVLEHVSRSKPDVVFNTASVTNVDLCEQQPDLAMRVNGEAVGIIARACREYDAFLIHVSTDYVFEGKRGLYREGDKPAPINVYGRSKLLGEEQLEHNTPNYLLARTSVLYGWGRQHRPNFATWLIGKLKAGENVRIVSDQFASPTFNTHLARMLLEAAERRLNGIIHMAGATRINRFDFSLELARAFRFDQALITQTDANPTSWSALRPRDSSLDVSKATTMLSAKPISVEEALQQFRAETPP